MWSIKTVICFFVFSSDLVPDHLRPYAMAADQKETVQCFINQPELDWCSASDSPAGFLLFFLFVEWTWRCLKVNWAGMLLLSANSLIPPGNKSKSLSGGPGPKLDWTSQQKPVTEPNVNNAHWHWDQMLRQLWCELNNRTRTALIRRIGLWLVFLLYRVCFGETHIRRQAKTTTQGPFRGRGLGPVTK